MLHQFQCQKEGTIFYYQHGNRNVSHLIEHCPVCGSKRITATGRTFPDVDENAAQRETEAGVIQSGILYDIHFCCTTPGPEPEQGQIRGRWTGEIDHAGKLTIEPIERYGRPHYLFPREITSLEITSAERV